MHIMLQPNTNSWTIEPFDLDHVAAAVAIENVSYFNPWSPTMFRECLASERHLNLALLQHQQLVAYLIVDQILDEGDLLNIAVHPKCRGQGAAKALLTHAIALLKDRLVKRMFLEVSLLNIAAKNLYLQLGFVEVGRRKGYYSSADGPVDALVMCKEFSG